MTCVIVGAGFSGMTLACKLMKKRRDFILINPTDYFHLNIASVRAVVVEGWAEKCLIPLSPCFGSSFKQGKVVNVISQKDEEGGTAGKVVLESGEEISFKYLVIATGTKQNWPFKLVGMEKQEALDEYKKLTDRVKEAKSIVVIGGGPTGVEIAAEFAHFYPNKEVTIVHNASSLVTPQLSERSQNKLQTILSKELNVKLQLNERVSNLSDLPDTGPGMITTEKSLTLEADVLFKSIGLQISTDAYKEGLASSMTDHGLLRVDDSFRVEGHTNIFALGDCTNIDEPKLAANAMNHGECMATILQRLDSGKEPVKYKPGTMPPVISLGPDKGFGRTKGDWTIPSFIIKSLKSRGLFTDKMWKDLNQKVPS